MAAGTASNCNANARRSGFHIDGSSQWFSLPLAIFLGMWLLDPKTAEWFPLGPRADQRINCGSNAPAGGGRQIRVPARLGVARHWAD